MVRKVRPEYGDEESVVIKREEVKSGINRENELPDTTMIGHMLTRPVTHINPQLIDPVINYLTQHKGTQDRLVEFVVAATAARWFREGFVAIIQTSMHRELYLRLNAIRDEIPLFGKIINLVASLGSLFPVNLFDVAQSLDWLKEHDADTWHQLRVAGMTSLATIFDGALKRGPQVLVANIDVRRPLTESDVKIARYIIKQHVNLGCAVLLTLTDMEEVDSYDHRLLLKGIKEFKIGRF